MSKTEESLKEFVSTFSLSVSFSTFRWVWAEGGQNSDFEQSVDVGGFGYPVRNERNIIIL